MSDDTLDEFFAQHQAGNATLDDPRGPQPTGMAGQDWARNVAQASCWAQSGNSFFPVNAVVDKVPPGAYRCAMSNTGPYIEKMKINIDHLLHLPDSTTEILLKEFNQFWGLRSSFDKRGFTFKRGMLMWGPPGSGKTSAVWQMTQRLIHDHAGVVVFVDNPQVAVWCMSVLRRIEPNRPLITVMEDLDTIIKQHGEHELLALLDGEFQLDNVVHLGTTNYPDLIPRRFIDRPSRFDTVMKVGMPSSDARSVYFHAKEPDLDKQTIARWVAATEGYSVAHLREVCIAIQCFKQPEDAVFKRLDKMKQMININEDGDERGGTGFLHHFAASNAQAKVRR